MLYIIEAGIGRQVVLLLSNLEMHSKITIKNYVELSIRLKIQCTNKMFSCKIRLNKLPEFVQYLWKISVNAT
jgi:hypothetical protein